ncbi:UNVERIFIED_CONTAM: hypothetical protein PYX00_002027 [Menopon gallinae]|uniref:Death domain-containing protein n=1 Tax=Menopon gallinae TaxID=328185 RepID=A0AAW2IF16_9NEOP
MKAKIMEITDLKSINLDESQKITDDRDFQKLTEDDVLQITLTVGERWREFARNLGTQESTIQELEDLNDKDYNVIVYEVLQQYLSRYPETTVGFMISVLEKSDETEAIRKLMRRDKRC